MNMIANPDQDLDLWSRFTIRIPSTPTPRPRRTPKPLPTDMEDMVDMLNNRVKRIKYLHWENILKKNTTLDLINDLKQSGE